MPEQVTIAEAVERILAIVSEDNSFPDPGYVAYYQLLKDRIIYLEDGVGDNTVLLQKQITMWNAEDQGVPREERKPIRLVIMSYGGNLDFMWMLVDAILTSETPVYTYNIGVAHSAAALIFMSGEKRFMTPNARVLIHEGSAGFEGDAGKVLDASESYKKALKRMKDYILERTEVPKSTLNKKRSNDWELSAEECEKYKVCTAVTTDMKDLF